MNDQAVVDKFKELITTYIESRDLAEHLEKVLWGYVLYMAGDDNMCGHPSNVGSLYWCKELLDVLKSEGNN